MSARKKSAPVKKPTDDFLEGRKQDAESMRKAWEALATVSGGEPPGCEGRVSVVWDEEAVYVVEEDDVGINVATGSPDPEGKALWIPHELLPLIVEAAQRTLARRAERQGSVTGHSSAQVHRDYAARGS